MIKKKKKKTFQTYWDHTHWKVPSQMECGKMRKLLKLRSPDLEFIKEIIKVGGKGVGIRADSEGRRI